MWKVYMHITPNGKKYIGITGRDTETRWKNGNGYYNHKYFFNAIKKYGWKNIEHTVIFKNLTEEEAKEKEIQLIEKYQTTNRKYGYNLTNGGSGRNGIGLVSEKQKEKQRINSRGKNSKLSKNDILDIKTKLLNGISRKEIKNEYQVTTEHLCVIIRGTNWGYIMPEFVEKYKNIVKINKSAIKDSVIKCYKINKNINKTSKIIGIGLTRTRTILVNAGFTIYNSNHINILRKKVVADYRNGLSKIEIMQKYKISSPVFNNYTIGMAREKQIFELKKAQDEMCELRLKGVTIKEIAKKFNCHTEKVTRLTKDFMYEIKKVDILKCYKLKDEGLTDRQVAKEINRDIDFVKNWISKRSKLCCVG